MAKTVADSSGDFTHAEMSNADGTTKEITIGKGERTMARERNYELIADNTKDSNKIEVRSETVDVRAMAVKDGATVMGGGRYVMAEASHNRATGSVYGDNAKMAIQTENAVTTFKSNCPNARCTMTVTETKSLTDKAIDWFNSARSKLSSIRGSDDQKALPNLEQPARPPPSEAEDCTGPSKGEKKEQKPSKDQHKSRNRSLF